MSERVKLHKALLFLIVAVSAVLRFWDLGLSSFRGDTILILRLAQGQDSLIDYIINWEAVSGTMGQMPMPAFFMKLLMVMFSLPPTAFVVRLPFALWGILTVIVAYFAGRRFANATFGLFLAAMVALSPFCIYFSREAYFYSSLVLGYFLMFWAVVRIGDRMRGGETLNVQDALLLTVALFFTCFSQMTGSFLVAAVGLYFLYLFLRFVRPAVDRRVGDAIRLFTPFVLILIPLMIAPWGPRQVLAQIGTEHAETSKSFVEQSGDTFVTLLERVFTLFFWGNTLPALLLLGLSGAGFIYLLVTRRSHRLWALVYFIIFQLVFFAVVRPMINAFFEARYVAGVFPFLLAALAYGLFQGVPDLLERFKMTRPGRIGGALSLIALALLVYPACLVTQLTGKPIPYNEISAWCDANLDPDTPVLVDRWYEPWNELRFHPSSNAVYTFTVPNEPLDTFLQFRWRETARSFFGRFPQGAYLEVAKTFWDVPSVGPWEWPRSFFAHHVAFTNSAGLKLRNWGLVPRGDFYAANTNRVVVEMFYNTRDDVLNLLQQSGIEYYPLFGEGWGFEKTGPMGFMRIQTRQFMEWHVLRDTAYIDLINFTPEPAFLMLRLTAVAPTGAKKITTSAGFNREFKQNEMTTWDIGPIETRPGINRITLEDKLWDLARNPLLVQSAEIGMQQAEPQ